jgi:hypothetical protein
MWINHFGSALVLIVLGSSVATSSWAGSTSVARASGEPRPHPVDLFLEGGVGTPLNFAGRGLGGVGQSQSGLSESWRRGAAFSGGAAVALDGSRTVVVSVRYGKYVFEQSKFSHNNDYNEYYRYTDVRGGDATSLAALVGLRFHKDRPNAWPYFELGFGYARVSLPVITANQGIFPTRFYGGDISGLCLSLEAGAAFLRRSRVSPLVSFGLQSLPGQTSVATARIGAAYH